MNSLCLDRTTWDLFLDSSSNIAVANEPYRIAQDVATGVRTFEAEVYFDTTLGMPYFQQILGQSPPVTLLKAAVVDQALLVPGVLSARCVIASLINRKLVGLVEVIDATGEALGISF